LRANVNTEKTPLLIGLRAARANLVPGLIVQSLMLALVVAYYFVPATHAAFAVLAEAKRSGGICFTIVASALAGGVLPEIFVIAIFQHGKITRTNVGNVLFGIGLWALDGALVDLFYRLQIVLFGSVVSVAVVFKKVLLDQFVFTPFLTTPLGMFCYEWKNQDYSPAGMSRTLTLAFYKSKTFPAIVAAWGVWIPLVSVIYSLPPLLQIPLFILALTFWVMLFNFISARNTKTGLPISAPITNPRTP
jgi:hypothetical protein